MNCGTVPWKDLRMTKGSRKKPAPCITLKRNAREPLVVNLWSRKVAPGSCEDGLCEEDEVIFALTLMDFTNARLGLNWTKLLARLERRSDLLFTGRGKEYKDRRTWTDWSKSSTWQEKASRRQETGRGESRASRERQMPEGWYHCR